eukprot:4327796-Amphidinium_carterae.1
MSSKLYTQIACFCVIWAVSSDVVSCRADEAVWVVFAESNSPVLKFAAESVRQLGGMRWRHACSLVLLSTCQVVHPNLAFRPADTSELLMAVKYWLDDEVVAESEYGHISLWDTSMVTDMSRLFEAAGAFNLEIGGWDTSRVTNMSAMFAGAVEFDQEIGGWQTAMVTDMSQMFADAHAFNREIGGWNTSRVADMSKMFASAWSFNQKLGNWDTSQ